MKTTLFSTAIAALVTVFAWTTASAQDANFTFKDKVGNGWHMETVAYLNADGLVSGKTTLKNYNNVLGFTGGLFVVALDESDNAVYASNVHKWGINAAFFSKCKTRTEEWSEQIPTEYLAKTAKFAVVQMHTPTNRVWSWIYENRQTIINHAKYVADLYNKYKNNELGADDLATIIAAHVN